MKVEKIRRYNEQYLNDILNGSNLTNGIPTLNETFTNTLNDGAGITRTLERTK